MKKLNNQTRCNKIDIYIDGTYFCSTDMCGTLKGAKKRFLFLHPEINEKDVKCKYFEQ